MNYDNALGDGKTVTTSLAPAFGDPPERGGET